jgi:hypothetical protein
MKKYLFNYDQEVEDMLNSITAKRALKKKKGKSRKNV